MVGLREAIRALKEGVPRCRCGARLWYRFTYQGMTYIGVDGVEKEIARYVASGYVERTAHDVLTVGEIAVPGACSPLPDDWYGQDAFGALGDYRKPPFTAVRDTGERDRYGNYIFQATDGRRWVVNLAHVRERVWREEQGERVPPWTTRDMLDEGIDPLPRVGE